MKKLIALMSFLMVGVSTFATPAEISGEVTLAKGVNLKPGGVLFVFAKKAGIPMPAAVLRIPDPKPPLKFTLSAKNAMAPGTPFEGPFTITARFSASGEAMDKSGPEASTAQPVAVGASDLKLELKAK